MDTFYFKNKMEITYCGDCHCLFCDDIQSDKCLKRYFDFNDIYTGNINRFAMCSEYIRIVIHNKLASEGKSYCHSSDAKEIIGNELKKYLPNDTDCISYYAPYFGNSELMVYVPVCEKLSMYLHIDLKDYLKIILRQNRPINKLEKERIQVCLEWYLRKNEKYAKYKKYTERFTKILKKMEWSFYVKLETLCSELLISLIEIESKKK